jgi:replicative DNA helicase
MTRVPPQDVEAEVAVLGAILLDSAAMDVALDTLEPSDFYKTGHSILFHAMLNVYDDAGEIDVLLVTSQLNMVDQLEAIGGEDYLADIMNRVPSAANVEHYANLVREASIRRRSIVAAHNAVQAAYDGIGKAGDVIAGLERDLDRAQGYKVEDPPLKDTLTEVFKDLDDPDRDSVKGVPTGYYELDELTLGLRPGAFIVAGGRPGMGKTSFAHNVAVNAAIRENVGVAFFSLEMTRKQLTEAMLASLSGVGFQDIQRGNLPPDAYERVVSAGSKLHNASDRLHLIEAPGITPTRLRSRARRLVRHRGVGLIIVDYLQIMGSDLRSEEMRLRITDTSTKLMALALELQVPVFALSQLNRAVENRTPPRPRMADLRESGTLEQDAAQILFFYREAYYTKAPESEPFGEVILSKNRFGPTDSVVLGWRGPCVRWENPTPEAIVEYHARSRMGAGGRPDLQGGPTVLTILQEAGAPMTRAEIGDEVGRRLGRDVSVRSIDTWLKALLEGGSVERPKQGVYALSGRAE